MTTRLERERDTVKKMIEMYCKDHHNYNGTLCPECSELMEYIDERLEKCPFDNDKPTCDTCTVHCYRKEEREQVRKIMRYTGPRMIYRHPVRAIVHVIDKRRGKHGDELLEILKQKKTADDESMRNENSPGQ